MRKWKPVMKIIHVNRSAFCSVVILSAALLTGACEMPMKSQNLPKITFAHLQPFKVDVASVEVVNRFTPSMKAPHIEHQLPISPAAALAQWGKDRLKAVGKTGKLRLLIEDARATETVLGKDKSLKGHFTKQQSHRYDLALRATVYLTDAGGIERGAASASATRSATVREDISLDERERTWFDLVDRLMKEFNRQMDVNLERYLSGWLR